MGAPLDIHNSHIYTVFWCSESLVTICPVPFVNVPVRPLVMVDEVPDDHR